MTRRGGASQWGNLQRERPVRFREGTDYVGVGCGEDVVYCIGRRDDTAAAADGGVAGLPGNDVACFFSVECLK
jgi:hypothetical protein